MIADHQQKHPGPDLGAVMRLGSMDDSNRPNLYLFRNGRENARRYREDPVALMLASKEAVIFQVGVGNLIELKTFKDFIVTGTF